MSWLRNYESPAELCEDYHATRLEIIRLSAKLSGLSTDIHNYICHGSKADKDSGVAEDINGNVKYIVRHNGNYYELTAYENKMRK